MNERSFVTSLHRGVRLPFALMWTLSVSTVMAQAYAERPVPLNEVSSPQAPDRAAMVLRYRCTLIDGSVRLLVDDPRVRHPDLADDCQLVRVPVAPVSEVTPEASPPWVGFAARVIEHRGIADATSFPGQTAREMRPARAMPPALAALVQAASQRHQLDPALVAAVMSVESGYRPDARSPKGALGLMQLMPATAARYGVRTSAELMDPRVNIDVGVRHLRALHDRYDGRLALMLAAYNAGEGAVDRHGQRVPPYAETEDYVRRITALVGVPESALTP